MTEIQQFGLNALTFTLFLTICCTLAEALGLRKQRKAIWQERSGASVSVIFFTYLTSAYAITALYGIFTKSLALLVDGTVLALSTLPILVGLWKFKGFTRQEKIIACLCPLGLVAMVALPWKGAVYLGFLFGNILVALRQPWEIWRAKSSGVVDITFLWTVFATMTIWSVYAFVFNDLAMEILFPAILGVVILTIGVWYAYRSHKPATAGSITSS